MLDRFGYELRKWRKTRGLSQERAGTLVHVSGALLHRIETGERRPTRDLAVRCDEALSADGALIEAWEAFSEADIQRRLKEWSADPSPVGTDKSGDQLAIVSHGPDIVTAPAGIMSGDPISASESVRLKMANVLAPTMSPDIEYLAETALQHAADSIHTPPEPMLRRILSDYNQTRILLSQRQPLRQQKELYRLTAQLGALIADELMVLGKPHHAESWQEMTRRAADETGDAILRAHVRTLAAMLPLYYGEPGTTVQLTREAQVILADHQHAAGALAPTLEALACAQLGDKESSRQALYRARRNFDCLEVSQQAQSVFGFSERRWRFYESRIMSFLDDVPAAIEAQQRALTLYPSEIVGDRALINLDMATCIVRTKDIASGLENAAETLLAMPADHRADIFLRCAWRVVMAVPTQSRSLAEVTEYCDLLRNLSVPQRLT